MKIDFHIHSKYSFDCFMEPSLIIDRARKRGLQGIVVADHDTMKGIEEFRRLARDLYVIAAQEISTTEGDIIGIFLREEVKANDTAEAVIREIRLQGGLAIAAHPFKWPHLLRSKDFLKQFDAIEVFNARNNIPSPYLENFLCAQAVRELGLPFVAGSDAHEARDVGRAYTIFDFDVKEATDEKIKDAILKKDLRIEGREISLTYEIVSHFSRLLKTFRNKDGIKR